MWNGSSAQRMKFSMENERLILSRLTGDSQCAVPPVRRDRMERSFYGDCKGKVEHGQDAWLT